MKKRMLALLIAVLMVAALLPTAAMADEPQSIGAFTVELGALPQLVMGENISAFPLPTLKIEGAGAANFDAPNGPHWVRFEDFGPAIPNTTAVFESGAKYGIKLFLYPKDGYLFDVEPTVTCGGRSIPVYSMGEMTEAQSKSDYAFWEDTCLEIVIHVDSTGDTGGEPEEDTLIETVEIAGLIPPVVGEMPKSTATSLTKGVGVRLVFWGRHDAEIGMTSFYDDDTPIEDVPFRANENYVIGVRLSTEDGYCFDPLKTKIVYNGKQLPLFGPVAQYENPIWPKTCGTIDNESMATAYINMADIVKDKYSGELFMLKGYELGKSAADITVTENYEAFTIPELPIGPAYAIALEKDGLPDLEGDYTGPFEANTPYWLAVAIVSDQQLAMMAADDGADSSDLLGGLTEEEMAFLRELAKEFDLDVSYNDAFVLPIGSAGMVFFRLDPLKAATAPTGHAHDFFCWNTDETGHWPVCYCGITIGIKDAHLFGEDTICDVCGYVLTVVEPEVPELPQTGDASYTALYMAAAGILALALCALLRKRA